MATNKLQFQPGLSMAEFLDRYGSEAKCAAALEKSRWPTGFRCPACGDERHSHFVREGRVTDRHKGARDDRRNGATCGEQKVAFRTGGRMVEIGVKRKSGNTRKYAFR